MSAIYVFKFKSTERFIKKILTDALLEFHQNHDLFFNADL